MSDKCNEKVQCLEFRKKIHGNKIGEIVCADSQGKILVDYPGNPHGPIPARSTVGVFNQQSWGDLAAVGQKIILTFEENKSDKPIVLGYLTEDDVSVCRAPAYNPKTPNEAVVDGKRVVLEGESEVVLRCGKASIKLTRAGKVLIRGTYLSNQSTGAHLIEGASVQLN